MERKYKIPFALALLSAALIGCSSNKVKEVKVKPNPLPKLAQATSLVPVFSQSVSATSAEDPLRLRLDTDNGTIFIVNPKGGVAAYKGKQRLWETKVSKHELSSGVEAADGLVIVGNKKGQLFALDQATGAQTWTAQLSGAIISPALIQTGRVIVVANDGTVFAFDEATGQQAWTYKLANAQFSLRGQAAPISIDPRTIAVATSNGYIYAIDSLTGVPRMQQRVAVSEGRSDIQRLIDIDGDPVLAGQLLVTTSYQGQVTATDLASRRVVWSEDASSLTRPEVFDNKVFVAETTGKLTAYDLATGQQLWKNEQLLNRDLSNPVVLGQNLVVGDLDGVLHLIDPNTGTIVGRSKTSGEVRFLRVIDNQLYVSTRKGALSIWQNR
ncbi:outer membrane protein assembly factor BamB [Acinetobacter sp. ANC 3832]|uniref:outer membrane protein assembly factor BamB n=1 Tax=Acinetobacter sp. ANC 3832 TaxID=1977874 RepID=UPI000A33857A|nr:outer membrane protein assembly factor BamB [Acinetobacter sp. ANC 3832]OTG96208.1 outer membrane protein assembly factor BamB [Acinetobacter sp. ANC 3832]